MVLTLISECESGSITAVLTEFQSLQCNTAPYPKRPKSSLIKKEERSFNKKYSSNIQYKEKCLSKIRVNDFSFDQHLDERKK